MEDLGSGGNAPQVDVSATDPNAEPQETGTATSEDLQAQLDKSNQRVDDLLEQGKVANSRADKAIAESASLRDDQLSKITEVLAQSAANGAANTHEDQQEAYEALGKSLDDADGKKLLDVINSYTQDAGTGAEKAAREKVLAEIMPMLKAKDDEMAEVKSLLEQVAVNQRDANPEYMVRKDSVQALAEEFKMDPIKDRVALIAIDKKLNPETMPRAQLPGSSTSTRVLGRDDSENTGERWTPEAIESTVASLQSQGLSEAEVKKHIETMKQGAKS